MRTPEGSRLRSVASRNHSSLKFGAGGWFPNLSERRLAFLFTAWRTPARALLRCRMSRTGARLLKALHDVVWVIGDLGRSMGSGRGVTYDDTYIGQAFGRGAISARPIFIASLECGAWGIAHRWRRPGV